MQGTKTIYSLMSNRSDETPRYVMRTESLYKYHGTRSQLCHNLTIRKLDRTILPDRRSGFDLFLELYVNKPNRKKRVSMRKWIIIVVIMLVVVGGGFVFIQSRGGLAALTSNAKSDAAATPLPAIQNSPSVIVNAIVVPNRYATLSLSASGTVADVLVKEGDRVNAGQLIAQLDNQRQVIAIAQAEANVRSARAHLGELKAGSRPEEIAQTQAAVDTANANLLNLKEGSRPGDIAAAQANLAAAEANLKQILAGADQADIINALVGPLQCGSLSASGAKRL